MRPIVPLLACLVAALFVGPGCGGASSTAKLPPANHGGSMAELSGGRGFVEVATEGSVGRSRQARIVAYFYQTDGTTAMTQPPTDVTVKLGTAGTSPVVPLSADAKSAGPEAGQRFASQAGPYPSGFEGKLEAKLGGDPVEAAFLIR